MTNRPLMIMSLLLGAFLHGSPLLGQAVPVNYDESKVPPYQLPDPLLLASGNKVASVSTWRNQQRPAIRLLFAEYVYGKMPGPTKWQHFQLTSLDTNALDGKAIRKEVTIYFTQGPEGPSLKLLLYLPKSASRVPLFLGPNYFGNQSIHPDVSIALSDGWMLADSSKGIVSHRATPASRGKHASRWPLEMLLAKGYGVATFYYGDLEADHPDGWRTGVRGQLAQPLGLQPREWGAIGAWAWGLSRAMDYLQTDPAVDSDKVAVLGHSRHGKAALWAAANDERFALVIANDAGEGGAALARRQYGETIESITGAFPHWFVPAYRHYANNPASLPVDQHLLLALMAPRPLYVASAQDDRWADPKGEFLSAYHATAVYHLFGKKGLESDQMPGVNQPVGDWVRYHVRSGKHDITRYDWEQYVHFADQYLTP